MVISQNLNQSSYEKRLVGIVSLSICVLLLIVTWGSMAQFYPLRYYVAFTIFLLVSGLLTFRTVPLGIAFLTLAGIFFGNHPGGRFVEIYCFALIQTPVWIWLHESRIKNSIQAPPLGNPIVLAACLLSVISFSGAYYLVEAFEGYKLLPFHFLSSRDWLPHYSVLIALLTGSISYSVWKGLCHASRLTGQGRRLMVLALLIGPALVMAVGLIEAWFPGMAGALDSLHIRLGGYVERSYNHFPILMNLSPALTDSPNSLFWNRSWLSVYLVSCLPLVGLALALLPNSGIPSNRRVNVCSALMFITIIYLQLLIGSRAGLLATFFFVIIFFLSGVRPISSRASLGLLLLALGILSLLLPFAAYFSWPQQILGVRAELFRSGLELLSVFPVSGGGVESFGFWNDLILRSEGFQRTYSSSHNFLLQIGVGYGIPGIIALGSLYFLTFHRLIETINSQNETNVRIVSARIILAGLASIILYGSFQEWWYIRVVQLNWWIAVLGPLAVYPGKGNPFHKFFGPIWRLSNLHRNVFASALLISLAGLQFWHSQSISRDYLLFENVGHLETAVDEASNTQTFRYPLLAGDGSFPLRIHSDRHLEKFECKAPLQPLTGPPDPRIICDYRFLDKAQIIETVLSRQ
ncbi:MAG: O-antigen ligase family protein [Leptospiraceae bacterium]